jgi:TRAP-type C4-dicarboxylate transport system permease small subunit
VSQGAMIDAKKGSLAKASDLSKFLLGLSCAAVLLGMMCLTGADVIARYLFNAPIKGAFELIEILMVVFIYMAFPLAILAHSNVEVELWEPTSRLANQFRYALAALCGLAMFGVFTVELFDHVQKYSERESVTNSLGIPLTFVAMAAMIGSAMCVVFTLATTFERMRSK